MEAFSYAKQAAEKGHVDAQFLLAGFYARGHGTAQDESLALFWAEKSASAGNSKAALALAHSLLERDGPSRERGLEILKKLTRKGHEPAAISLSRIYALGEFGVPMDEAAAEATLLPFANAGRNEACVALASLYLLGKSFPDKRESGIQLLEQAAARNHTEAVEILKSLKGTPQSLDNP